MRLSAALRGTATTVVLALILLGLLYNLLAPTGSNSTDGRMGHAAWHHGEQSDGPAVPNKAPRAKDASYWRNAQPPPPWPPKLDGADAAVALGGGDVVREHRAAPRSRAAELFEQAPHRGGASELRAQRPPPQGAAAATGAAGSLLAGPRVEACKMKWAEAVEDKYSLLVPMHGHVNYSRYFEHYGGSPKVDRLVIVWSNKNEPPPDWSMYPKVCTVVQETDSLVTRPVGALPIEYGLNNRFRPYACIRTVAVFSVDNDMLIPTNYMDFAFDTWRLFPYNLVGFAIRTARRSQEAPQVGMYEIWWTQYANNRVPGYVNLEYNLVFTNAAIFHRELLNEYTCSMPAELREMVSRNRSCEDITMNVLSHAKWRTQPIGISTKQSCVDNYGVGPKFKRSTGGLAKKGDMPSYELFRGRCYRLATEYLKTEIPLTNVTAMPYNDHMMCPKNHVKPGQLMQ